MPILVCLINISFVYITILIFYSFNLFFLKNNKVDFGLCNSMFYLNNVKELENKILLSGINSLSYA